MRAVNVRKTYPGRGRPALDPETLHRRAERILDAAAHLVLERGYDAISMDDIAHAADLAKGTLYEHWPSREELFLSLVHREQDCMASRISDALPNTLEALIRETARALLERPLLVAVLVENSAIWGRQLQRLAPSSIYQHRIASFVDFLTSLRNQGRIRTDQTLSEQITVVTGVLAGFLMARDLIPPEHRIDNHSFADVIAETVARALGSTTEDLPASATSHLLNTGRQARKPRAGQRPADPATPTTTPIGHNRTTGS